MVALQEMWSIKEETVKVHLKTVKFISSLLRLFNALKSFIAWEGRRTIFIVLVYIEPHFKVISFSAGHSKFYANFNVTEKKLNRLFHRVPTKIGKNLIWIKTQYPKTLSLRTFRENPFSWWVFIVASTAQLVLAFSTAVFRWTWQSFRVFHSKTNLISQKDSSLIQVQYKLKKVGLK